MPDLTQHQALQLALRHHQAGDLRQAEAIYRQILASDPRCADALHLLGAIAIQTGQHQAAVDLIRQATILAPTEASYQSNLGEAYRHLGRFDEAIACYRQAIAIRPGYADAYHNLGVALQATNKLDEAIDCYRRVLALQPRDVDTYGKLGLALLQQKQFSHAITCYRQALAIKPDHVDFHVHLGFALRALGQPGDAMACFRQALALRPNHADAHNMLGVALSEQGRHDEAVACYHRALAETPDHADARVNLGNALKVLGQIDLAVACYRQVLALKPDHADAEMNLGVALFDQGYVEQAADCFRRVLAARPDCAIVHSHLICALQLLAAGDVSLIHDEHVRWQRHHARPLAGFLRPHANDRSQERRLRIGYVSADFHEHPVARFLLPVLSRHDRNRFEVFCYSALRHPPDGVTQLVRSRADRWRDIAFLSDEQAAELIRQDGIDILVDLMMHTGHNRLLIFARKPAPVQVTYLAYCGGAGLDAIDYRFTDPFFDPPGAVDERHAERSVCLSETYWCYEPAAGASEVAPLPALAAGHVTFGCLNSYCKVSAAVLAVWCRLLQSVPQSRLIVHAREGSHRQRAWDILAGQGIAPDRLSFVAQLPLAEYLGLYGRIDICLDPFPYGGGMTTCEALWMGAPVVTLAGHTAVGRGGVSILSNIGLCDLIARTQEEYVSIAAALAGNLSRLAQLRSGLRRRMLDSPLMDAARFTRDIESACRAMWRNWCGGSQNQTEVMQGR